MKFALITGASGGIGKSTALRLAEEGWNLYLHYNTNRESIEILSEKVKAYGVEAIPLQANLANPNEVVNLVEAIFQVDAVVYCSGIAGWGLFQDQREEDMDIMINIHVKSPMLLIQSLLKKIIQKKGSIVIVSSIWGQIGGACEVIYSTVKGAQLSFVKSLGKELAPSGVRVNAVAPGAVNTDMMKGFTQEELEELEEEIPLGRMAYAEEVADSIEFLLSNRSSYITSQTLSVNGGWST